MRRIVYSPFEQRSSEPGVFGTAGQKAKPGPSTKVAWWNFFKHFTDKLLRLWFLSKFYITPAAQPTLAKIRKFLFSRWMNSSLFFSAEGNHFAVMVFWKYDLGLHLPITRHRLFKDGKSLPQCWGSFSGIDFQLKMFCSCWSTALEHAPHDREVKGLNPAGCWAFFFSYLSYL